MLTNIRNYIRDNPFIAALIAASLIAMLIAYPFTKLGSEVISFLITYGASVSVITVFRTVADREKRLKTRSSLLIIGLGVAFIVTFAMTYLGYGLQESCAADICEAASFWDAIYFSIVTATTLGYGDFAPPENIRLIAAFQAIVGYAYLALYVGYVLQDKNNAA